MKLWKKLSLKFSKTTSDKMNESNKKMPLPLLDEENFPKEQLENFMTRMMSECIFVNFKCYFLIEPNKNISTAYNACAIYPTLIPNINGLIGEDVNTYWKLINNNDQTLLFIEIKFPERKFAIGSNDKKAILEFCKTVKSLGFMTLTNDPLVGGGIKIPIVQMKVIDNIINNLSAI